MCERERRSVSLIAVEFFLRARQFNRFHYGLTTDNREIRFSRFSITFYDASIFPITPRQLLLETK